MTTTRQQDPWNYHPAPNVLHARILLITGATSGIGRALALATSRLGATIILADKTINGLENVYDEIIAQGSAEPAIYPIDLSGATRDDYQAMADALMTEFGKVDGLVNNAGWIGSYVPFQHYDMKLYQEVMMVNLHAPFMLTQAMLPLLEKSDDPTVVFSTHAHDVAYAGAFGIAKAGLEAMMKILADEYDTETPIRFNAVDTGVVDTQMRRLNFPGEDWSKNPKPESVITPYLYFLSPDSQGVSGINCRKHND